MRALPRSQFWIQPFLTAAACVVTVTLTACASGSAERMAAAGQTTHCENEEPPLGSRIVRRTPCVQLTAEQREEQRRRVQEMRDEQISRGTFGPSAKGGG